MLFSAHHFQNLEGETQHGLIPGCNYHKEAAKAIVYCSAGLAKQNQGKDSMAPTRDQTDSVLSPQGL